MPKSQKTIPFNSSPDLTKTVRQYNKNGTKITPKKHTLHVKLDKSKVVDHDPATIFSSLNVNEYYRYLPSSKHVGHAIITHDKQGNKIARQYTIANQPGSDTIVHPLTNIEEIHPYGMTRYKAETADDHTPMYATRYVHAKVGKGQEESEIDIACFSPRRDDKAPFWGSDKSVPLFRDNMTSSEKEEFNEEMAEIKPVTKGGDQLKVEPHSVLYRDQHRTRTPDQNGVMGESAVDAFTGFLEKYEDTLSPEMITILKQCIVAPLRQLFGSQRRPEWLHGYGFSLTPISQNPQREDNLGAAPKWANTEMMVLERIARWFALNQPEVFIAIKPHFDMLLDSELIKHIHFEVTLKDKENWITFLQEIDPLKRYPLFRKPSDLAQSTVIAYNLMHNVPAAREELIASATKEATNNTTQPVAQQEKAASTKKPASTQASLRETNGFFTQETQKKHQSGHLAAPIVIEDEEEDDEETIEDSATSPTRLRDDEAEEVSDVEEEDSDEPAEPFTFQGVTPGAKRFFNMISSLEERYKDADEDADEDEELEEEESEDTVRHIHKKPRLK